MPTPVPQSPTPTLTPTPSPPFTLHPNLTGIDIHNWTISTTERPIATSAVEEALTSELGIKLPGMLFDQTVLRLTHPCEASSRPSSQPPKFNLVFRAVDALSMVGEADPNIQVKAAANWGNKSARSDVEIGVIEKASDWTFSTWYPGSLNVEGKIFDELDAKWRPRGRKDGQADGDGNGQVVGIDYDALRNTDIPILFSSQVILFEDELDDNGTASYKVRIRVMPDFFFILARFFLRVDGVLVRIFDTRYFHRFGTSVLVRESVTREGHHVTSLRGVHPSVLRDPDMAAQKVPLTSCTVENIAIPD